MHHKRKRTKNQRAGCIMCKPHKNNAWKDSYNYQTFQEKKALELEKLENSGLVDDE